MNFNIEKYESILAKGLCEGLQAKGQVCIEHALCLSLGEDPGDHPSCVEAAVRNYSVALNDLSWSSPEARAQGLRDLGLAQLGSKGAVDGARFTALLAEKTIRILIPTLFRELFPGDKKLLAAADRCEQEGTQKSADCAADAAVSAAYAATDARATSSAAYAAAYAARDDYAYGAARAAARADAAAAAGDRYLLLSAKLAVEVLRELDSPGVAFLDGGAL